MNPHWIQVFNTADDDDIIFEVAHDLELIFLPTDHRLFDQDLVRGTQIQPALRQLFKFLRVESDASAGATERK